MLTDQIFASSIDKQAYLARYPSQFWDGLSETPLNDCALEHVCRMTSQRRDEAKAVPQAPTRQQMADHEKDFAKAGGPDFAFLRAVCLSPRKPIFKLTSLGHSQYKDSCKCRRPFHPSNYDKSLGRRCALECGERDDLW